MKSHEDSVSHKAAVAFAAQKAEFDAHGGWQKTLEKVQGEQRRLILHNMIPETVRTPGLVAGGTLGLLDMWPDITRDLLECWPEGL